MRCGLDGFDMVDAGLPWRSDAGATFDTAPVIPVESLAPQYLPCLFVVNAAHLVPPLFAIRKPYI